MRVFGLMIAMIFGEAAFASNPDALNFTVESRDLQRSHLFVNQRVLDIKSKKVGQIKHISSDLTHGTIQEDDRNEVFTAKLSDLLQKTEDGPDVRKGDYIYLKRHPYHGKVVDVFEGGFIRLRRVYHPEGAIDFVVSSDQINWIYDTKKFGHHYKRGLRTGQLALLKTWRGTTIVEIQEIDVLGGTASYRTLDQSSHKISKSGLKNFFRPVASISDIRIGDSVENQDLGEAGIVQGTFENGNIMIQSTISNRRLLFKVWELEKSDLKNDLQR